MKKIIPLNKIKPIEFLIPQDKWEEIASHYDGTVNSISQIFVYESNGSYIPENGNKRAAFLYSNGHQTINAYIHEHDQEEIDFLEKLVEKAQKFGIKNLEDLSKKVIPRAEYDSIIENFD